MEVRGLLFKLIFFTSLLVLGLHAQDTNSTISPNESIEKADPKEPPQLGDYSTNSSSIVEVPATNNDAASLDNSSSIVEVPPLVKSDTNLADNSSSLVENPATKNDANSYDNASSMVEVPMRKDDSASSENSSSLVQGPLTKNDDNLLDNSNLTVEIPTTKNDTNPSDSSSSVVEVPLTNNVTNSPDDSRASEAAPSSNSSSSVEGPLTKNDDNLTDNSSSLVENPVMKNDANPSDNSGSIVESLGSKSETVLPTNSSSTVEIPSMKNETNLAENSSSRVEDPVTKNDTNSSNNPSSVVEVPMMRNDTNSDENSSSKVEDQAMKNDTNSGENSSSSIVEDPVAKNIAQLLDDGLQLEIDSETCEQDQNFTQVVSKKALDETIALIMSKFNSQKCNEQVSLKLKSATNRLVNGFVMEVGSMPVQLSRLTYAPLTRVYCWLPDRDGGSQADGKFNLILEQEHDDQWLSSRWRLHPQLKEQEDFLTKFKTANSIYRRKQGSKPKRRSSDNESKCSKFKVEQGRFFLELLGLRNRMDIEVTMTNGGNSKENSKDSHQQISLTLLHFEPTQLFLDKGVKFDGPTNNLVALAIASEKKKTLLTTNKNGSTEFASSARGLYASDILQQEIQKGQVMNTVQILHERNNHVRKNNWLFDMYANWFKHEYRMQLKQLLGQPLVELINDRCFNESNNK